MADALALLMRTADFAAKKHTQQRRKDPQATPFINHPIGVANLCAQLGGVTDVVVLQAALLHDTVEDTDTSMDELRREFGDAVTDAVAECTDDKSLPKEERKRLQIAHGPHMSARGKTVKLADTLYNLRDVAAYPPLAWPRSRVQGYFTWAWYVVANLRGTNSELEAALDQVFAASGTDKDGDYPLLPARGDNVEMKCQLETYLGEIKEAGKVE